MAADADRARGRGYRRVALSEGRADYVIEWGDGTHSGDGDVAAGGVTALECVGITVDPVSRTLKRLPAIPLK